MCTLAFLLTAYVLTLDTMTMSLCKLTPIPYENSAIDVDVEELYANLPSKYQHRILVLELALKRFSSAAAVALKR